MCGLTACLDYNERTELAPADKKHSKLEREVDESLELVKHRGPDARGQWISSDERIGMIIPASWDPKIDCGQPLAM